MGVITLTGHLGSMGYVAPLVADRLGYRLVDRELVIEAGAALGWTPEQAAAFDERSGGLGHRLMDFLDRFAVTQTDLGDVVSTFSMTYSDAAAIAAPAGERYIAELKRLITAFADDGDVVIVGRGGQAILAGRRDAMHFRVACPVEERVRRTADRDRVSPEVAQAQVEYSDREREAWHRRYLGIDYRSPYHYSLIVNTGSLPDEVAAGLIVSAYESRLGAATA